MPTPHFRRRGSRFFVSLVVLDPLVVVLAAFVRREGIWLAAGVMAVDVVANWIGNWPSLHEDPARLLRPAGLLPITLFGVFVLVTTLPLLRVMRSPRSPRSLRRTHDCNGST